jgi:hypothetical protein
VNLTRDLQRTGFQYSDFINGTHSRELIFIEFLEHLRKWQKITILRLQNSFPKVASAVHTILKNNMEGQLYLYMTTH